MTLTTQTKTNLESTTSLSLIGKVQAKRLTPSRRLYGAEDIETEWIVENFFDSKESYKAVEQFVSGKNNWLEFLEWFELFVEGCREDYAEYEASLEGESRFSCGVSEDYQ